jgi:methylmalonyl-CoA/ethylmalonyl-CoA epimerase
MPVRSKAALSRAHSKTWRSFAAYYGPIDTSVFITASSVVLPGFKLHHVGWAVDDIEKAVGLFAMLGYGMEPSLPERVDPNFEVRLRFLRRAGDEVLIELVAPAGPASSVSALLKRSGAGPYHLGFRVDDLEKSGAQLAQRGFLPVTQALPAVALEGRVIRFWRSPVIGLIELIRWL